MSSDTSKTGVPTATANAAIKSGDIIRAKSKSAVKTIDEDARKQRITVPKSPSSTLQYDVIGGQRQASKPASFDSDVVSRLRIESVHRRLGRGRLSRRDGLIGIVYSILVTVFLFGGAGVFRAIDGHIEDDDPATNCLAVRSNCSNETVWSDECEEITRDLLNSCPRPTENDTMKYDQAVIYVITVTTTIGYGEVVTTGVVSQLVAIYYSIISIPLFLAFLTDVVQSMRDEFAVAYGRVMARRRKKRRLAFCPDLVPFFILTALLTIYMCVAAAIYFAFRQFDSYEESCYFLFESVTLIGFGDVMPKNVDFQLVFIVFITLGCLLHALCSMVLEEWTKQCVELCVNKATGGKTIEKVPEAEMTLTSIMDIRPNLKAPATSPPSTGKLQPAPSKPAPPPHLPPVLAQEPSASPTSIHARKFSIGRFGVAPIDDGEAIDVSSGVGLKSGDATPNVV